MSFKDYYTGLFGLMVFLLFFGYMFWCITILISYYRAIFFKRETNCIAFSKNASMKNIKETTKEEQAFIKNILSRRKEKQVAVAFILKDFISERNRTICENNLKSLIPSSKHII